MATTHDDLPDRAAVVTKPEVFGDGRTVEEQYARNLVAIELLESFLEDGDPEEQKRDFEMFRAAIDEDRPEGAKVYEE